MLSGFSCMSPHRALRYTCQLLLAVHKVIRRTVVIMSGLETPTCREGAWGNLSHTLVPWSIQSAKMRGTTMCSLCAGFNMFQPARGEITLNWRESTTSHAEPSGQKHRTTAKKLSATAAVKSHQHSQKFEVLVVKSLRLQSIALKHSNIFLIYLI